MARVRLPRLWTPGQDMQDREPTMICRVPVKADGSLCLKEFYDGEERAWQEHMRQCVSDHRDVIHALSPKTRMPWMDPNNWDPEVSAHNREVGKRMLEEGRLVQKPHERAGG